MKKLPLLFLIKFLMVSLILIIAGCGGDGDDEKIDTIAPTKILSSITLSKSNDTLQINRSYDLSEIAVTASYSDNTNATITKGIIWTKTIGKGTLASSVYTATADIEEASFTASYSYGTVTKTASFGISVRANNNTLTDYFKFYHTTTDNVNYSVKVDNANFCPFQIETDLTTNINMIPSVEMPNISIVNAMQTGKTLFTISPAGPGPTWFNYAPLYYMGDPNTAKHNDAYVYYLPYEAGTSHILAQGFNGAISHSGKLKNSLDFVMPVGTKVCAAREGVVIGIKEDSNMGGNDASLSDKANYIVIYHIDGTFSEYLHLKQYGSAVNIGDTVMKGQVIGYSGTTGYSMGPHLHFMVVKPVTKDIDSVSVKMLTTSGPTVNLLEGASYTSVRN